MKVVKKILKVLIVAVLLTISVVLGIIVYAIMSDYKPKEKEVIFASDKAEILNDSLQISLITWNIGYCGLDKEMDFFYDGGTKVFTPQARCLENLHKVKEFLTRNNSTDFILLQEVDKDSKRSYHINQFDSLTDSLRDYYPSFAMNYDVFFVPVPVVTPMGKVLSGLVTLSKYLPSSSVRYTFPGEYGFPKQLFMLDRCFLVNRYPLSNGKELLVINTHKEAFDSGQIRMTQMAFFRDFILNEFHNGNYIVAGGDWNQLPPDFQSNFSTNKTDTTQMVIPNDYLSSGWEWLYDNRTPSERNVMAAYDPLTTTTNIFDFFLISPNIRKISIEGIHLHFENSDHNPVRIEIALKN